MADQPVHSIEELVKTYSSRVYHLALRITGNPADAEDVLQETFLTVMQKLDTFEGRSAIYTWIHRIATNTALGKLRRLKSSGDTDIAPEDFENLSSGQTGLSPSLYEEVESNLVRQALDEAIQRLPENLRVVFLLRDVEGFSTQETADMLNLTTNNVKVRLMRARIRLRNDLSHLKPEGTNS